MKRLQAPLRSPLRSNNGQPARNDVSVDIRMINEANIGRKRNARDRARNSRTMITNFRKQKEETAASLLDVPDGITCSTTASSTESESSFTM